MPLLYSLIALLYITSMGYASVTSSQANPRYICSMADSNPVCHLPDVEVKSNGMIEVYGKPLTATTPADLIQLAETIENNYLHYYAHTTRTQCLIEHAKHTDISCLIAKGQGALRDFMRGDEDIADGTCAGASLQVASHDILLGDYVAALPGYGFVNIDNRLCFWRTTGQQVSCPPPELACMSPVVSEK